MDSGPVLEGFRVARTLEASRQSHIKVEAGGVECIPGCLAPAWSSPAAPFNPYCICNLLLLGGRARPSRLGWTCPRLPAPLACSATLWPRDADCVRALGGGLQELALAVARSPQRHSTHCTLVPSRETPARPRRPLRKQLSTCGLQTGRLGLHSR